MTFIELAKKVLSEANEPLTTNEVWEIAEKKYYVQELNSSGVTPKATLGAQMYTSSHLEKIGARPVKFRLKENVSEAENPTQDEVVTKSKYKERDLHKVFVQYAFYFMNLYSKTIFHETSQKQGRKFNEWVHPDIVSVIFKFETLSSETLNILNQVAEPKISLCSFELKKGKLDFTNLREYYFQAVSNSSWANEGYLVAEIIDDEQEFQAELSRLVNTFGIGIIQLDKKCVSNSKIIYKANIKNNLDFEMIDKLTKLNPNFEDFLNSINRDTKAEQANRANYDAIAELEQLT